MPVVEAVGIAVAREGLSTERHAEIESAMLKAVQKAQAEGVTDPEEIKRRMLTARDATR